MAAAGTQAGVGTVPPPGPRILRLPQHSVSGGPEVFDLTPDGTRVSGGAVDGEIRPAVWTLPPLGAPGVVGQPVSPASGPTFGYATGLSPDGSVAVGNWTQANPHGFRWTLPAGPSPGGILAMPQTPFSGEEYKASAAGGVVAGSFSLPNGQPGAAVWRSSSGAVEALAGIPTGPAETRDVSADGRTVVGTHRGPSTSTPRAFVWTQGSGSGPGGTTPGTHTPLPQLGTVNPKSWAMALADGGQTIVGSTSTGSLTRQTPARWTSDGAGGWTVQALTILGAAEHGQAWAASADGSIIGGIRFNTLDPESQRGFLWTQSAGMLTVNQYASLHGLDLTGWQFTEVRALSADGLTLAVRGADPAGRFAGYVVQLPAPGAAGVLAGAGLLGARRRGQAGGV